jgi:hypothetical protein
MLPSLGFALRWVLFASKNELEVIGNPSTEFTLTINPLDPKEDKLISHGRLADPYIDRPLHYPPWLSANGGPIYYLPYAQHAMEAEIKSIALLGAF